MRWTRRALRGRRPGRRGAFLAFLAILDTAYGYSLLQPPARPGAAAGAAAARSQYPILPERAWAVIWLAAAAVCASGILARSDRVQYAAAATLKVAWAARSAWLWHLHVPLAWISVTVWLAFAATVIIIAGWPEPGRPPVFPPPPRPGVPP